MMRSVRLGEILVQYHLITREQLKTALAEKEKLGMRLGEYLIAQGWIPEDIMIQVLGEALMIRTVNLNEYRVSPEALKLIPADLVMRYHIIPLRLAPPNFLDVAMDDPTNLKAIEEVERIARKKVRPLITSTSSIVSAMELYYGIMRKSGKEAEREDADEPTRREKGSPRPEDAPHPELERLSLTISLCIEEVFRNLGPGFALPFYGEALVVEMKSKGIAYERDVRLPVNYKKMRIGTYTADFLLNGNVLVAIRNDPELDETQICPLKSRMANSGLLMGILINFGTEKVDFRRFFTGD